MQTVSALIDFHSRKKYTMDVNETRNCLVTDILLNIIIENGKTQLFNSGGVVK